MKFVLALFVFALVFTAAIYTPNFTFAQDSPVATPTPVIVEPPVPPDQLPDKATDLLPDIEKWLLFVAGLLATHVMSWVKEIPWFGKQKRLVKLVTELLSGLTASVLAFLLGTAAVALGFLDESGLWQVIVFAWPAAVGIYHGKKFSRAKGLLTEMSK